MTETFILGIAHFGGESDEVLSLVNYAWWDFTIRCMNACNDGRWYVNREKSKTEKFTRQNQWPNFSMIFRFCLFPPSSFSDGDIDVLMHVIIIVF